VEWRVRDPSGAFVPLEQREYSPLYLDGVTVKAWEREHPHVYPTTGLIVGIAYVDEQGQTQIRIKREYVQLIQQYGY
jgi:hypothetical protein